MQTESSYGLLLWCPRHAVFGLTIDLSDLRTKTFTVPGLTEPEAIVLLKTLLQDHVHERPETELTRICTQVVSQIGTRPLGLMDLHQDVCLVSKARGKLSRAALEDCVTTLLRACRWKFWFALRTCMIELAGSDPAKEAAFINFVKVVQKGLVPLTAMVKDLGISEHQFIAVVQHAHQEHNHGFYIQHDNLVY